MIEGLNKHFESRVRLGVMSVLMVNELTDFKTLKETLNLTDGNLASHIAALEKNGYILVFKEFVGKKPKTTYKATSKGKEGFTAHLNALESLLNMNK
ncbi:MAG: winged helix-turn-helix domain-containing protein [Flavobacteriales bacterium]